MDIGPKQTYFAARTASGDGASRNGLYNGRLGDLERVSIGTRVKICARVVCDKTAKISMILYSQGLSRVGNRAGEALIMHNGDIPK